MHRFQDKKFIKQFYKNSRRLPSKTGRCESGQVPFVTHAGSGMSGTSDNIRDICTGADVLNGLAVTGETAQNDFETTQAEVSEWLEKINIE